MERGLSVAFVASMAFIVLTTKVAKQAAK